MGVRGTWNGDQTQIIGELMELMFLYWIFWIPDCLIIIPYCTFFYCTCLNMVFCQCLKYENFLLKISVMFKIPDKMSLNMLHFAFHNITSFQQSVFPLLWLVYYFDNGWCFERFQMCVISISFEFLKEWRLFKILEFKFDFSKSYFGYFRRIEKVYYTQE